MSEKNIRLDIQYNGVPYAGWQYQPDATTIQGEIIGAIEKVTGKKVTLHAAGRTDAGVHALGQVANFHIDHHLPVEKYKDAINYFLSRTILITAAREVPDDFNARRSAKWRHYRYIIDLKKSAHYFDYRWEYPYRLEIRRMEEIARDILGRHDFSAFCRVSSQKEYNDCEVISSGWRTEGSAMIYDIKADRFLHTMVRSLVGVMTLAGREKDCLTLGEFKDIMASGDHTRVKSVAPARGLYLVEVGY
ncbi:MAG: tRNA pseudouridine(38-40) synthase TruA [Candidatus Zixiibacteriota bacterium]|nr:MAG: tRNA pseudouridine(38-40) synthase TruA [candidate division Zixibacteria bacterium]